MTTLTVSDLRSGYGAVEVLHGIDLSVAETEFTVVLGMNGAGKTTLLGTLMGLIRSRSGAIELDGIDLKKLTTRQRIRHGMGLVPEGRHVFPHLTVEENVRLGGWGAARSRAEIAQGLEEAYTTFPRLKERRWQQAGRLSGGEQQMVAICRALVARPRVLLVDECSLGLAPIIVEEVFSQLADLRKAGMTVLAVEQSPGILMHADTALILDRGELVYRGEAAALRSSPDRLRMAFLGGEV